MDEMNVEAGSYVRDNQAELATAVTDHIYGSGIRPSTYAKSLRDVIYHLSYLSEALLAHDPGLFADYAAWAKVVLINVGLAEDCMEGVVDALTAVLSQALPANHFLTIQPYLAAARTHLQDTDGFLPSFIAPDEPFNDLSQQFMQALLQADRRAASHLILDAVESGTAIKDIYLHVFQRSQHEIGRLWQLNQISVAQEHYCTAATQLIMSQLYPRIFESPRNGRRLVSACVASELHEMGARMVADFFEMDGWDTYYLGANAPASSILQAIEFRQADVLAISATMTYHLGTTADLIAAVRSDAAGKQVKILVGGYPFQKSPDLWQRIGADGWAGNAQEAVAAAETLVTVS